MSFLNNNNSEFLSARITQKGRNSIAKGNFNISFFQIGDSEFDYTSPFNGFTGLGNAPYQRVMAPFDKESGVKYPYKLDSTSGTTTYGVPIENSTIESVRNLMGPGGYISDFKPYDNTNCTGTTIECPTQRISTNTINGTSSISVPTGSTFLNCQYISLVFGQFGGLDANVPVVTGNSNSLIYRIASISGNTINLDRATPNLSILSGYTQVVCNNCENEYPNQTVISPACVPEPIDSKQQLNPWTLNTIYTDKPIGFDVNGMDENLTGFTSNVFVSAKELLGYTTSTGQTYSNLTGGTINHSTSYTDTFGNIIDVPSEQQRNIAIIHYSQLGDIKNDPERFFKYDDYISSNTSISDALLNDVNNYPMSDAEYFEVYIPFIRYHRNTDTTIGATFSMDTTDYYLKSTINPTHRLLFRFLLDEQGNRVGKIFVNNKIVVFDDQELVAILDYKSNRKYTLPAPTVKLVNSDLTSDALISSTGQTIWITYMFSYTYDSELNSLPCNYFSQITGTSTPSQVTIKFNTGSFNGMGSSLYSIYNGFIADKFMVLVQEVDAGDLPRHDSWYSIDITSSIPRHTVGNLINPVNLSNYTFTITGPQYSGATLFDLSNYLGTLPIETSTAPNFGDEQPFPGSVRVVRAIDIQQMKFLVNLPSSQFTITQNPTHVSGNDLKITEVALLDSNKEVLVIAKTATPITRLGAQVFAVKLDF